ncbi:MBL fold metallo-hydrolase [Roseisolibacter sp. H3M3-2]|uniref:MBL fold metallo-hydrolase n=1 Tax=Roseisolibacter sp. H3M3-2 TaxID=3031323 RepID=UPI0023DBE40A|nr:MBL fold metallo-hydrolase [Roseisolibacter sp. H3M3-2]MDF1503241.1 MBL fold metallo-hydrolase [Roseisolibacter sp. H3M3-2]
MAPTRRDFLVTSAGAALAAALAGPLAAFAQPPQPPPAAPTFTPVRRNVGTFTMRGGTVGWLVSPRGVVVVDTQFPAEARALLEGLQARSGNRGVDLLVNTHHHGDHSGGNGVFRGVARKVVAHGMADQHMRRAPGAPAQPPAAQPPAATPGAPEMLYPDTTFQHTWAGDVGDERVVARHYGRGHTSGDAVITFERANVVHMGDLLSFRRHPVVDRAAGASMRNWARLLQEVANAHARDTVYICGHANTGLPVTVAQADVLQFRDYLLAVLALAERQVAAGRPREEALAMREPMPGFEAWGAFPAANARDPLTAAYEEVAAGA